MRGDPIESPSWNSNMGDRRDDNVLNRFSCLAWIHLCRRSADRVSSTVMAVVVSSSSLSVAGVSCMALLLRSCLSHVKTSEFSYRRRRNMAKTCIIGRGEVNGEGRWRANDLPRADESSSGL